MPVVITGSPHRMAAYEGDPSHRLVLGYAEQIRPGSWVITVGGVVRHRYRRRSALRTLHQLAVARLTNRALARTTFARREAVGGGVIEHRTDPVHDRLGGSSVPS